MKNNYASSLLEIEKFKLAVESSTDAIVMTDTQANIVYVNPAWQNLTGYSYKEVLGKNPRILKSGKNPPEFYQKLWSALNEGKPFVTEEVINRKKDGTEYSAYMAIYPIVKKGEILFYVGLQQDITKRKEVEKAKTEFVSLASHQLRTPLSAINWYTEMLLAGDAGKLNPTQKDYLAEIYFASRRMSDLVTALLNVSRIEMGSLLVDPKSINFHSMIDANLKLLEEKIKSKGLIVVKDYCELENIHLDPKLTEIVIQNILSNATKYTLEKGKIKISTKTDNKYLYFVVQDDGIGIPKMSRTKIFEKLYRAENAQQVEADGTGLGLYIVKSILDKIGGAVTFDKLITKGSIFTVKLPLKGMTGKKGIKRLD